MRAVGGIGFRAAFLDARGVPASAPVTGNHHLGLGQHTCASTRTKIRDPTLTQVGSQARPGIMTAQRAFFCPRFYSTPRVLEGPKRMSCIYSCKAFPGRIRAVPQVGAIAPRHRHRRLSGCRIPLPCRILDTKGVEALSSARQSEAPGASSAPAWNQRSAKVHALLRADANRPRRQRRLGHRQNRGPTRR